MDSILIKLVIALVLQKQVYGQSNTIIFGTTTTTTTTAASPLQTTIPSSVCMCTALAACLNTQNTIDLRIVNTGPNCTSDEVFCCMSTSGNLVDPACGVRKIAPTQHPQGQASYGAYPWQAALLTSDNAYVGSGVLINSNHVLTVAHKMTPYLNGGIKVRLGDWDGQVVTEPYPYQEYTIEKIFLHPNFNALNLQNDIALLRLNSAVAVSTSPNINTACLPTTKPTANTRCWVSGWGKDAFGVNGKYQSIMKEVDVPIWSEAACEASLRNTRLGQFFILDRNNFLCAGGEAGKDACTGDGGAPLVCESITGQWQVIGMVAWGIGCAGTGVPGVYVNVVNFIPWINQQIQQD